LSNLLGLSLGPGSLRGRCHAISVLQRLQQTGGFICGSNNPWWASGARCVGISYWFASSFWRFKGNV